VKNKILSIFLLVSLPVSAEIQYDVKKESHRNDVSCIAAFSIARDRAWENGDNLVLHKYTDFSNQFFLKYDRIPSLHIDARKILLKNARLVDSEIARCTELTRK